jgi:hypothetical protein
MISFMNFSFPMIKIVEGRGRGRERERLRVRERAREWVCVQKKERDRLLANKGERYFVEWNRHKWRDRQRKRERAFESEGEGRRMRDSMCVEERKR